MPRAGECREGLDYPGKHILIGEKLEVLILWLFAGLLWIREQCCILCPQRCHEQMRHSLISRINATVCFLSLPWIAGKAKQQGSYLHFLCSARTNMPSSYTIPVPSVVSSTHIHTTDMTLLSSDVAWWQQRQSISPRKPKCANGACLERTLSGYKVCFLQW